ncbi:MAG: phosphatidate cytidylyltransferase [Clostridiales bacterium]|nr:MAG: phosphatidate cytidylyltransferase [Clostridiales bacterium]
MSTLQKRVLSAIVALVVLGAVFYAGGVVFKLALTVVAGVGVYELYNAFKLKGYEPNIQFGITLVAAPLFYYALKSNGSDLDFAIASFLLMIPLLVLIYFVYMFSSFVKTGRFENALIELFGGIYVGMPMIMLMLLYNVAYDEMFLIFIIAFASDTFAYFTGTLIGKNKLCPTISPNKTKEGALGALVGTVIVLISLKFLFYDKMTYFEAVALGVIGSALAQIGDLTASILKRFTGIKDFGKIMPGHGGVLDRLDSIIFVTPLVLLYVIFKALHLY